MLLKQMSASFKV